MCGETLRDREFDSQVSADTQRAANAQQGPSNPQEPSKAERAREALKTIGAHAAVETVTGIEVPAEQRQRLIEGLLEVFYLGNGEIDDVGLLDSLAEFAGKPLTPTELGVWGRVAGLYCATRAFAEFEALPDEQKGAKLQSVLGGVLGLQAA